MYTFHVRRKAAFEVLKYFFSLFLAFTKLTFEADVIPRRGSHIPKVIYRISFFPFPSTLTVSRIGVWFTFQTLIAGEKRNEEMRATR